MSYVACWPGLISNLRVVVGSSVYNPTQTTITVPTSALANIANTQLLLNTASSGAYLTDTSGVNTVTNTGSITYNTSSPVGTPSSNVAVTVNGSLHATGNITFDGNVVLGDAPTDTITFAAEVNSNILPITSGSYSLGSTTNLWNTIYTNAITVSSTTIPTTSAGTLNAGNFSITGTTITNTSSNNNFNITPNGTGTVQVNGTVLFATLQGNNIPNTSSAPYIMANTGAGYYKFGTTSGLSIPSGSTAQRPGYTEIGMMRYNTDVSYGEVYNGSAWIPIGGISASLTLNQVTSIMLTNVIVFGR
jgi:hypothetical protein